MQEKMSAALSRVAKFGNLFQSIYLFGVVMALVLIIPAAWFPLQAGKLAVFATISAIATIAFIASGRVRGLLHDGGFKLSLLTTLLPIAYAASFYFSTDKSIGLYGYGLEVDTVFFAVLGCLALMLSFGFFRTVRSVRMLVSVVFFALIVATIFQAVAVVFGTNALPFATFADRTVNLIGKWNDLGLILGIMALWSLIRLEWSPLSRVMRPVVGVVLVCTLVLLGIIHFAVAWILLGSFSAIIAVVGYLLRRPSERQGFSIKQIPILPVVVVAVCILFLIFGTMLNARLTTVFPVTSLEVRPSYDTTMVIIRNTHTTPARMLLGTGPNTFGEMWLQHKPVEVNLSAFWNLDFSVGYSTLMTAFAGVGLLGAAVWFIPMLLVLLSWARVLRSAERPYNEKLLASMLAIAATYLWLGACFYVMSQNLIVVAFVLSGALLGFAFAGIAPAPASSPARAPWLRAVGVLAASLVLVLAAGWTAVTADRLFLASVYTNQALLALNVSNVDLAAAYTTEAQKVLPTGDNLRLASTISMSRMQALAVSTSTAKEVLQKQFTDTTQQAIAFAQRAAQLNPMDYRSYVTQAQVYDYLASLKVQGAYPLAEASYAQAVVTNPTNPSIPLMVARLEAGQGKLQNTQAALSKSLTLKQNYTDAILFVVQLDVAQKDIPSAIQAAQAAVQSAPGVASIWFELGLLYYSANDTAHAIAPLEQAIALQSDYANAKYFLGLSYYAQNRAADALKLFQDLHASNPDNQEVSLILSNMQAGKPAFNDAQPPVSQAPQTRPTAPIQQ
jgi:tetratricopeptide (TPR) repeat protein